MPPKGHIVEQQRMDFYLDRAAQTRLSQRTARDKGLSNNEMDVYVEALDALFYDVDEYISQDILTRDSFGKEFEVPPAMRERIWSKINKSSSPGFPFADYPTNEDVGIVTAFEAVEEQLRKWWQYQDIQRHEQFKNSDREERCRMLLRLGLAPPASSFIKGEPTSKTKVARVIYGTSLITNIISVMCYGGFLDGLKDTWDVSDHKVGLDMYTEEGLKKFETYLRDLFKDQETGERARVMSSDVQGWEYQVREWMFMKRIRAYCHAMDGNYYFHKWLISYSAFIEIHTCVIDSAGYVHCLPFYITFSGKRDTHFGNSFDRAALARLDEDEPVDYAVACTNGDDCLNKFVKPLNEPRISDRLGFVITDREEQTLEKFNFCSQEFTLGEDGHLMRRPESIAKIAYNFLSSQDSQLSDIVLALNWPEAIHALYEVKKEIDLKLGNSSKSGVSAFQAPNEAQTNS